MGIQIIKQPNTTKKGIDLYSIFSSISDSFIAIDLSEQHVIDFFREAAANTAEERTKEIFEHIKKKEKPYFQFTLTYKEAWRRSHKTDKESG